MPFANDWRWISFEYNLLYKSALEKTPHGGVIQKSLLNW